MHEARCAGVEWRRHGDRTVGVMLAMVLAVAGAGHGAAASGSVERFVRVIVQALPGASDDAARAVTARGGAVTRSLPLVNGFAAAVPADALAALQRAMPVAAITLDRAMTVHGKPGGGGGGGGGGGPVLRSMGPQVLKADDAWAKGWTGRGVTVALIDTGVSAHADLAGRVVRIDGSLLSPPSDCVNMTSDATCTDAYGHGTFMAGIIAGDGASSGGAWKGTAPGASILSVKVAGADGATDVSTVLAAIQWVVSFKDRYGIRVLNLSLGTDSSQTTRTDPLNYAVQRAWDAGIVVVVSASNRGPASRTISKPADDPLVITVGGTDDRGTEATGDDTLPDFSGRGPTAADGLSKPDLVAPGADVVSLNVPGSAIDRFRPGSVIDGAYRAGAGTSMSAAAVSGLAALMIGASPKLTPNRVKHILTRTATGTASKSRDDVGSGTPNVLKAITKPPTGEANAGVVRSNGTGLLDASRGTVTVQADDPLMTVVNGMLTAQLLLWNPVLYQSPWTAPTWPVSQWYGAKWYGAKWYGAKWYGAKWYGAKWYGTDQPPESYGSPLPGGAWLGAWQ